MTQSGRRGLARPLMAVLALALTTALITVPWEAPARADDAALTDQYSLGLAPEVTGSPGLPAGYVRLWDMGVAWRDVNPSQGAFTWTVLDQRIAQIEAAGSKVLYVAGLTPDWATAGGGCDPRWGDSTCAPPDDAGTYSAYLTAVMQRYGSRIAAVESWNEANLKTFWNGTPAQMADLTERAYGAIKAVSPATKVFAASTTTRLVSSVKNFFGPYAAALKTRGYPLDGWTIHTYPAANASPVQRYDSITAWRQVLSDATKGDDRAMRKAVWDTEINYGLAGPGAIPDQDFDDATGAAYLARTYLDSIRQGIDSTFWYLWTAGNYGLVGVQMNSDTPMVREAYGFMRLWTTIQTFISCDDRTDSVVRCYFNGSQGPFYFVMSQTGAPVTYTGARLDDAEPIHGDAMRPAGDITVGMAPVLIFCRADQSRCTPSGVASSVPGKVRGPGKPRSITMTPGQHQLTVSWDAPVDDGSSPITGYQAYTTGPGAKECYSGAAARTCVLGPLPNRPVRVYVKARNAYDWGPYARAAQDVTPNRVPGAPYPPSTASATAAPRIVTVSWSPPESDGGRPITGYRAFVSSGAQDMYQTGDRSCTAPAGARSCDIKGLPSGTRVRVKVQARNSTGWGGWTQTDWVTPTNADRLPGVPTEITAKPGLRSISVTWEPPRDDGGDSITSYNVYFRQAGYQWWTQGCLDVPAADRACTLGNLNDGWTYNVSVEACTSRGCGVPGRAQPDVTLSRLRR